MGRVRVIAGTLENLIWTGSMAQTAAGTLRYTSSEGKYLFRDCMAATFWAGRPQTQTHTQLPSTVYYFCFLSPAYLAKAKGKAMYLDCRQGRGIWGKLLAVLRATFAFGRWCTYVVPIRGRQLLEHLDAHLILTTKKEQLLSIFYR